MKINIKFTLLIFFITTYSLNECVNCYEEKINDGELESKSNPEEEMDDMSVHSGLLGPAENTKSVNLVDLDLDCKFCCNDYDYFYNDNTELFEASKSCGFKSIIYGIEKIWTSEDNEYLVKLEINNTYPGEMVLILYLNNDCFIKINKDSETGCWKQTRLNMKESDVIKFNHPSEITIITEVCAYPIIQRINDISKYEVKRVPDGYHYSFDESAKLIEIRCEGISLWKRGNTDEQPLSLLYGKDCNKIVFTFYDWTYVFEKVDNKWVINENSSSANGLMNEQVSGSFSERYFKFLTECSPNRNDPSKYSSEKIDDDKLKYSFKPGVKCTEVRYGGMTVWEPLTQFSDTPKEIYINKNSKTVTLIGENITVYVFNEIGWSKNYIGTPKGLELNINKKKPTENYDLLKEKRTKILLFKAKPTTAFKSVKDKNKLSSSCCCPEDVIWEARGIYEFATKVLVASIGSGEKIVLIYLIDGSTKKFKKTKKSKNWQEVDQSTKIPIEVNIKSIYESIGYSVRLGYQRTYVAKEGFVFKSVYQWNGLFSLRNKVIWRAKSELDYSNKVLVEGIGTEKCKMTIFIAEGGVRQFYEIRVPML